MFTLNVIRMALNRDIKSKILHLRAIFHNGRGHIGNDTNSMIYWKRVLSPDTDMKIQSEIVNAIERNPADRKWSPSESECVEPLIRLDISKMTPFIQTYYMYSIWDIIMSMDMNGIMMSNFEEKLKKMDLPEKYANLLKITELSSITRETFLSSLLKLV